MTRDQVAQVEKRPLRGGILERINRISIFNSDVSHIGMRDGQMNLCRDYQLLMLKVADRHNVL